MYILDAAKGWADQPQSQKPEKRRLIAPRSHQGMPTDTLHQTQGVIVFKGWVPTITTRLWFAAVGDVNNADCVSENVADRHDRFIACYQKRQTLDSIIPAKYIWTKWTDIQGAPWFACLAETREADSKPQEVLFGKLLLFHDQAYWLDANKAYWHEAHKVLVHLQNVLRFYERERPGMTLRAHASDAMLSAQAALMPLASFHVDFELRRSGEVTIWHDDAAPVRQDAPSTPLHLSREEGLHVVASQLFYFLKDMAHRHQHHNPKTDTVVDLYIYDGDKPHLWRLQTLETLYIKVIRFKRVRTRQSFVDAMGVMAYAQAFRRLCSRDEADFDRICPVYDDEALNASLVAAESAVSAGQEERIQRRDYAAAVAGLSFALTAYLISLVGLIELTGKAVVADPSQLILWVAKFVMEEPMLWFCGSVTLALGPFLPERMAKVGRALVRFLQMYRKRTAALGCGAAAFLVVAAVWWFLAYSKP